MPLVTTNIEPVSLIGSIFVEMAIILFWNDLVIRIIKERYCTFYIRREEGKPVQWITYCSIQATQSEMMQRHGCNPYGSVLLSLQCHIRGQ
jgi:hemolysin-activating ACP:hemolysin acyltransferase